MAKSVLALYDDFTTAQEVVQALENNGFDRDSLSIVANDATKEYAAHATDASKGSAREGASLGALGGGVIGMIAGLGALAIPGIGPVVVAGPLMGALVGAGVGAATGGIVAGLMGMGLPEKDAHIYAEGIRRGGTLVTVRADEERADEAVAIMNRYNPIDLERSSTAWREQGWSHFDETATTTDWSNTDRHLYRSEANTMETDTPADTTVRTNKQGETRLPVMEEELKVGKRTVNQGGVRVHTHVEQVPVEEQVTLREERVIVERRPVDRPVSEADLDSLRNGTIEVAQMAEEAVISKEARVIEEIVIRKDVEEHTETISDTVRRTDVEVEEVNTAQASRYPTFESYDTSYRTHFRTTYPSNRSTYEQHAPAYRYGYNLGTDTRYRGRAWEQVEPEARRIWEARNPNTWDEFKASVRHAWNELTD